MLQVLLYFALNFSGFFFFLYVWNRLPKPKPFDYTTIPGIKLDVNTAEEIPDLVKKPGSLPDRDFKGHFDEVSKFTTLRTFLQFLLYTYGPLNSFWWFDRYVVTVSNEKLVSELKKNRANLIAISPFSIGSYLNGDPKYCTAVEYDTISLKKDGPIENDPQAVLAESVQDNLVIKSDVGATPSEDVFGIEQIKSNLRRVEKMYESKTSLRSRLSRPLVIAFDAEIEIDAHPIPKYIPIIINTEAILTDWSYDELFPKFYAIFYWLPGFYELCEFK
ncbi:unnamed protein product [Caenorhabditis bovis]|uniref:Uncharacterized protein n=1 Tax=Caenorhabditis bovis TaxID=2654633 RepID=A0A8S1ENA0_9PELO|nr:unnamed protein product [Caenorhabditis bovis]